MRGGWGRLRSDNFVNFYDYDFTNTENKSLPVVYLGGRREHCAMSLSLEPRQSVKNTFKLN